MPGAVAGGASKKKKQQAMAGGDGAAAGASDPASKSPQGGSPARKSAKLARVELPYTPLYQRFVVKKRKYSAQFSHLYSRRFMALQPVATQAARAKWASGEIS